MERSNSLKEVFDAGIGVDRGLRSVHGAGLVQRDVHAHNVVQVDTSKVMLVDWGLAVASGEAVEEGLQI